MLRAPTLRRTCCVMALALTLALTGPASADEEERFTRTEVRIEVPELTMVDQNGTKVQLRTLLLTDRPVLVEFIYATCTTICPILSAGFASIQRKLGAGSEGVRLVSITIDPEHDTPHELMQYLERYSAKPGWSFLTGTREQVDTVMRAFDTYVADKMSHRPLIFVRTPGTDGWVRLYGFPSGKDLLGELQSAELGESE